MSNPFLEASVASADDGASEMRFWKKRAEQLENELRKHACAIPSPPNSGPTSPLLDESLKITQSVSPQAHSAKAGFKLSSQVLTITREGMVHKSLADILMETAGRTDLREPDTPAKGGGEGSAFDVDDKGVRRRSLPDSTILKAAQTSGTGVKMVKEVKRVLSRGNSPTKKKKDKGPPPLDSAFLDRIATVHSLAALRLDKMLHKPFPPTARMGMDYVASAYNDVKNTFHHDPDRFYTCLKNVCAELLPIVRNDPVYARTRSPCYAFGDTHGNYGDVSYFLDNIINFLDLEYTPCNLIFLGDYVDRGPFGLEVLCLLLSLKLSNPTKVTMLRGNHEDPLVNGDVRHYGDAAFQKQCQKMFGTARGNDMWRTINEIFRHFPLCADIDGKIFCCHGGIPRYEGGPDNRLELLRDPKFPHLDIFSTFEPATDASSKQIQMASDLTWSDPKDTEEEAEGYWELNEYGFGNNTRGDGVICFGEKAIDDFCQRYGFQYVFRAHQEKSDGLKLAKSGRVITIFSSSDYEGHRNGAGVLFVNSQGEIRMIMKSPF